MTSNELISAITQFPVFGAKKSVRVDADNGINAVVPIGIKLTVHHDSLLGGDTVRMQVLKARDNDSIFNIDSPISFIMKVDDIEFLGYENRGQD